MWREFNLINSFTLEVSFCGPTIGLYKDCHFTIPALKEMGTNFCKTLIDYANNQQKVQEAIHELELLFPPTKDELNGPISLTGPGMDKNKEDRAYFGYGGVSPRGDEEEEGDKSKKNKEKKKKKPVNALTSGLRK